MAKRYIQEDGSADVGKWLRAATPATSRLTWIEIVSAAARRVRAGTMSSARLARIESAIDSDARGVMCIELTESVEVVARRMARAHALRAGDAIQLAGALEIAELSGRPIAFVVYDAPLATAARAEGLKTLGA